MKTISKSRAERLARNINAMDMYYQYIDQLSKYNFWSDLRSKLFDILDTLSDADKEEVKQLCKPANAEYFGLA